MQLDRRLIKLALIGALLITFSCNNSGSDSPTEVQSTLEHDKITLQIADKKGFNNLTVTTIQAAAGKETTDNYPVEGTNPDSLYVVIPNETEQDDSLTLTYELRSCNVPILERTVFFRKGESGSVVQTTTYTTLVDALDKYFSENPDDLTLDSNKFSSILGDWFLGTDEFEISSDASQPPSYSISELIPEWMPTVETSLYNKLQDSNFTWSIFETITLHSAEISSSLEETVINDAVTLAQNDENFIDEFYLNIPLNIVDAGLLQIAADSNWGNTPAIITLSNGDSLAVQRQELSYADFRSLFPAAAVSTANPSEADSSLYPVVSLSWYEAILYCNKLSGLDGLDTAYSYESLDLTTFELSGVQQQASNGWRLPTFDEWSELYHAGKLDSSSLYYWGSSTSTSEQYVNWGGAAVRPFQISPSLQPTITGIYNLGGNVQEWLFDGPSATSAYIAGSNPTLVDSMQIYPSSAMDYKNRDKRSTAVGLRLVRNP